MITLVLTFMLGCGAGGLPKLAPVEPASIDASPQLSPHDPLPDEARCARDLRDGCFVALPSGSALVGAQSVDADQPGFDPAATAEDGPVAEVVVNAFVIQRTEVSARSYRECVDAGWCSADDALANGALGTVSMLDAGTLPASGVSWDGARRFCAWLGARLPTEAEWTWAAQGEARRRFAWGDEVQCAQRPNRAEAVEARAHARAPSTCGALEARLEHAHAALYDDVWKPLTRRITTPERVRLCDAARDLDVDALSKRLRKALIDAPTERPALPCDHAGPPQASDLLSPTPEGIRGMTGSLWEWTSTRWEPGGSPSGWVQKGGSWMTMDPVDLRTSARTGAPAASRLPDAGFRCAR